MVLSRGMSTLEESMQRGRHEGPPVIRAVVRHGNRNHLGRRASELATTIAEPPDEGAALYEGHHRRREPVKTS
jgi:hypothetical protein